MAVKFTSSSDPLARLDAELGDTRLDPMRRRLLVISNPHATTVADGLVRLVISALSGPYDVTWVETTGPNHATELCRDAVDGRYDAVVSFGGDGTVNECANGLAHSSIPLIPLPGGTTNVLGKMLGMPGDLVDATTRVLDLNRRWRVRQVDLAQVNDRYFTFSAGLGIDAAVVKEVDVRTALKHRYGPWFFLLRALHVAVRDYLWRPTPFTARADTTAVTGISAFVQNGDPFTFFGNRPLRIADGARLDSGTIAGAVICQARLHDIPSLAYRILSGRAPVLGHHQIAALPATTEMTMRSPKPVPLHVDGDYIGDVTEAHFRVVPGALSVVG